MYTDRYTAMVFLMISVGVDVLFVTFFSTNLIAANAIATHKARMYVFIKLIVNKNIQKETRMSFNLEPLRRSEAELHLHEKHCRHYGHRLLLNQRLCRYG